MNRRQLTYLRELCAQWFGSWRARLDHFHARTGVHVCLSEAKRLSELWGFGINAYTGWSSPHAPKVELPRCGLCGLLGGAICDGKAWDVEGKVCGQCARELEEELMASVTGGRR